MASWKAASFDAAALSGAGMDEAEAVGAAASDTAAPMSRISEAGSTTIRDDLILRLILPPPVVKA
jgi:hypothetical protein